jgi:uncharacterized protein (DUF1800 family)
LRAKVRVASGAIAVIFSALSMTLIWRSESAATVFVATCPQRLQAGVRIAEGTRALIKTTEGRTMFLSNLFTVSFREAACADR